MDYTDLLEGITDQEEVVNTRFGIDMEPASICTVIDIGAGDGLWSAIMQDYSPDAKIYQYDWRPQAVSREDVREMYLSTSDSIYVPYRSLMDRFGNVVEDYRKVPGKSFIEILKDTEADPVTTVMRVAGVPFDTIIEQLYSLPPLLGLIIQTADSDGYIKSNLLCEILSAFYTIENKTKGEIINVYAKFNRSGNGKNRRQINAG